MKISVLVPSEEYKASAGNRIRYGRIGLALDGLGIELSVDSIGSFDPARTNFDVLLVSKCHDARALMIAGTLADQGVCIGVDLFDDYFSDASDSRLIHHRGWLSELTNICDFALCSTRTMADVVTGFNDRLPVHVMNDPAPEFDAALLAANLKFKMQAALDQSVIQIGWYGIGDNPYFPVGLDDLASYGSTLSELSRSEIEVKLTVLTNKRALSSRGLSLLQQLPVRTEVREWSEAAEQQLLATSLVIFLPVNFQPFSRAKSLNRAVTALSAGCQVLSAGYPLYAPLDPFIYRDASRLVTDLAARSLQLAPERVGGFRDAIDEVASSQTEARRLFEFLSSLRGHSPQSARPIRLIHGHSTRSEAHRLVQALGGLSVASPYTSARLEFDVVFRGPPSSVEMLVSRRASAHLRPFLKARLGRKQRFGDVDYLPVTQAQARSIRRAARLLDWHQRSEAFQLATYAGTMRQIERHLDEAFGHGRTFHSEHSRLPFVLSNTRA